MKRICIYILLLFGNSSFGQNLVPNSNLEIFDTCPNAPSQIQYAPPWLSSTLGTPDYYNACFDTMPPWSSIMDVPYNFIGFQNAKSGNGYAGLFLYYYTSNQTTYREYIQVQLLSTLIAGQKYYVRFNLSLADSSNTATDDVGVHFSANSITSNNWNELPVSPQVENSQGNFLDDKINWMPVSGEFIAQGGESFLTIGNFKDFFNTDSLHVQGGGNLSTSFDFRNGYYYIDDICVSSDSLTCSITSAIPEYTFNNSLNVYPNPSEGNFVIDATKTLKIYEELNVSIYNQDGTLIEKFIWTEPNKVELKDLSSGLYLIKITSKSFNVSKKITVINNH